VASKKRSAQRGELLLGTAGWTLPRESVDAFPPEGSHLERYSRVLPAVEINSTFHRPHRSSTYARWAETTPDEFRFCLKVPKTITHKAKLVQCHALLDAFLSEIEPLAAKVRCLLVQLPPSLAFDRAAASEFFAALRKRYRGEVACEPRHASWFEPQAERLLVARRIARVGADPERFPGAMKPGGWGGMRYFRLHGAPRMYYSSYSTEWLGRLAQMVNGELSQGRPVWCMFDNTVTGAAMANVLELRGLLQRT
jgi:uncharacterized protein YecE (DUF72 family)